MQTKKLPLSRLVEGMTVYPQTLFNVRVWDKKAVQEDPEARAAVKAVEEVLGDSGCILVRVMVEVESQDRCRELAEGVAKKRAG